LAPDTVSASAASVRFAPKVDNRQTIALCPLCANSVLTQRSKQHRYSIISSAREQICCAPITLKFQQTWSGTQSIGHWKSRPSRAEIAERGIASPAEIGRRW